MNFLKSKNKTQKQQETSKMRGIIQVPLTLNQFKRKTNKKRKEDSISKNN